MSIDNKTRLSVSALVLAGIIGCANVPVGNHDNDGNGDENLAAIAVVVGPGFTVAHREGDTGGAQEVAICGGWFPADPNHVLTVETGLGMAVRVVGDADARLWILCGQSNFCGEQAAADTWEISRFWGASVCDVYVGTAAQGGALEYALEFDAQ